MTTIRRAREAIAKRARRPCSCISRWSLGPLCLIYGCAPVADRQPALALSTAAEVVIIDSATWANTPALVLDSLELVCPVGTVACPDQEVLLAGLASDGDLALGTRFGSVFIYRPQAPRPVQAAFALALGNRTGFGGSLEPLGDSAWYLHLPDSPARIAFSDSGRLLDRQSAPLRVGYSGSAARDGIFARLLVPGAGRVGDSVPAIFEVIGPPDRLGEVLATRPFAATFVEHSVDVPLPPFFYAPPIWGLVDTDRVFFSDPQRYAIDWIGPHGVERRLEVHAPPRAVTDAELEEVADRFMSKMPTKNQRFLQAVQADTDRRRRSASRYHPAITDIRILADGRVFVRRLPSAESDSVRWEAFSPDLAPLGFFELDGLDRLLLVRSDSVLLARGGQRGMTLVQWSRLRPP